MLYLCGKVKRGLWKKKHKQGLVEVGWPELFG